jgi:uncharacterized protein (TIGR02270 family)
VSNVIAGRDLVAGEGEEVMSSAAAQPILSVVREHVAEASFLSNVRVDLVHAPHVRLLELRRHDERIAAHLDGVAVAGEEGWQACTAVLDSPSAGAAFTAMILAIGEKAPEKRESVVALACRSIDARKGVVAALGWAERTRLQGVVASLLMAPDDVRREIGIAVCALHRVDPGLAAGGWIRDASPLVRARAFRAAGEIGLRELSSACTIGIADTDPRCQFWAAWSAVLLGDRNRALDALNGIAPTPGPYFSSAFTLGLQAMSPSTAHTVLQRLSGDSQYVRWLIQGSGIVGDAAYVPWLINHMTDYETARIAGEAFTNITGLDLYRGFDTVKPEGFEGGPSDDSNDEDVAMDPDEGLPWPDPSKIQGWWAANGNRFQPGVRYFIGEPVTRAHCIEVLKSGYQRQRILAARYLSLANPGTPLFNTSAPASRQQGLLAQM